MLKLQKFKKLTNDELKNLYNVIENLKSVKDVIIELDFSYGKVRLTDKKSKNSVVLFDRKDIERLVRHMSEARSEGKVTENRNLFYQEVKRREDIASYSYTNYVDNVLESVNEIVGEYTKAVKDLSTSLPLITYFTSAEFAKLTDAQRKELRKQYSLEKRRGDVIVTFKTIEPMVKLVQANKPYLLILHYTNPEYHNFFRKLNKNLLHVVFKDDLDLLPSHDLSKLQKEVTKALTVLEKISAMDDDREELVNSFKK